MTIPVRKDRWLLALLLLANGRALLRQDLVDALWPEGASDPAYYLRRSLSHLRGALPRHAGRFGSVTRQDVRFDRNGDVFVDALAFEEGASSPDPARWREAVSLYVGPLLPDCHETWVLAPRLRLHRLYQDRVARLGEAALASGEAAELEPILLKALEIDPLWEEGRRLWMRTLVAQGQPHEAVKSFHELQRLLQQESPSHRPESETEALALQIRNQARRPTPRPAPARPVAPPPSNLPEPVTRFIGREREVARAVELLGQTRLLTLTGAGGCGKTRLSQEVAQVVREDFPDGVWWVELAPVTDPALVLRVVAEALDVREVPDEPLVSAVVGHLKARRALLVLDNCEHVLDAAATQIGLLLRSCPGVKVLASSREALNGAGETAFRVPSLTVPEPDFDGPWERLQAFESVRLFVERARAAKPEIVFPDAHTAMVASICRRLDGIPLAIELAAARVRSMTLAEIERRIDDRFAVLTGGSRTAPARHQTLHALIDWSYQLLTPEEQVLLRRLSVFADGWTLDAAEAVCAGEGVDAARVLDLLVALVDRNLVVAAADADSTRYQMLETIRQFGEARLRESAEERRLFLSHARFYGEFLTRTWLEVRSVDLARWLRMVARDYDNAYTALRRAQDLPEYTERVKLFGLWEFWMRCGYHAEPLAWRETFQVWADQLTDPWARGGALGNLGAFARHRGEYDRAWACWEEVRAIHQETGFAPMQSFSLLNLGEICMGRGDYDQAVDLMEQTLALVRQGEGDSVLVLNSLGCALLQKGDLDRAQELLEEALAILEGCGARVHDSTANTLQHLSEIALHRREFDRAERLAEQSLEIHREMGMARRADSPRVLGGVAAARGDFDRARSLFGESFALHREAGGRNGMAQSLESLASVAIGESRLSPAAQLLAAASVLRESAGVPRPPVATPAYDAMAAACRSGLGEEAFAAAWEDGRAMPLDDAVALALSTPPLSG